MVPFLGPSSVRDFPSRIVDSVFGPLSWADPGPAYWVAEAVDVVDTRARLLPLDAALDRVFDKYGFIRDAYLQQRNYAVHDGDVPEETLEEGFEDLEPEAGDGIPLDDGAAPEETPPAADESRARDATPPPPATP
jgi:phospholipid-binding lipoprotein MlaA